MFSEQPTAAGYANPNMNQSAALQQKMAYAAQSAGMDAAPVPQRDSDAAIQRLVDQISTMERHASRLSSIADRVVGARPQEVGRTTGEAAHPAQMPFSVKLALATDYMTRINQSNCETIERLESFA